MNDHLLRVGSSPVIPSIFPPKITQQTVEIIFPPKPPFKIQTHIEPKALCILGVWRQKYMISLDLEMHKTDGCCSELPSSRSPKACQAGCESMYTLYVSAREPYVSQSIYIAEFSGNFLFWRTTTRLTFRVADQVERQIPMFLRLLYSRRFFCCQAKNSST